MKKNILIAAIAVLLVSCSKQTDFDASGTFEATRITVSAEGSGILLNFDVQEGDKVEWGQQLGVIDTVQLYLQKLILRHQAASVKSGSPDVNKQVAGLRVQLAKQQQEKTRIERLLKDGAAPTKQLDDINAQIDLLQSQLNAQLEVLNNSVASLDQNASAIELQIAQVDDRLNKCHIAAPLTGTVLTKYKEVGEFVAPGTPLLEIADLRRMYLRAYFTSDQLKSLKLGQQVKVVADFGGGNCVEYPGTITWISENSEFTPKAIQTKDTRANLVYAVKIMVENDGKIKIGLYGEVIL